MSTGLLPGIDPSENDLIDMALAMPFERKVDRFIEFCRTFATDCVMGNSGGKDSVALKWGLKKSGVIFSSVYNKTTIDPPELIYFLKDHHKDTAWHTSPHGHLILDRMVQKMSMPTRLGKWCCSEYKDCCSGSKTTGAVGVRIEESARRAGMWKEITYHNKTGRKILAPLAYWTEDDVWRLIHENNIPYCELYDQGFSRLGCVGCPINTQQQAKEFDRWPKFEAMWKEGARMIWEYAQTNDRRDGRGPYKAKSYKSPEELYRWWRRFDEKAPSSNCVFEEMMENV